MTSGGVLNYNVDANLNSDYFGTVHLVGLSTTM